MFLRTMNIFLPILTPQKLYGMELADLQRKEESNQKMLRRLAQKQVYLRNRIKGLNETLATLEVEAKAEQEPDPVDNTPTFQSAPVVNHRI